MLLRNRKSNLHDGVMLYELRFWGLFFRRKSRNIIFSLKHLDAHLSSIIS